MQVTLAVVSSKAIPRLWHGLDHLASRKAKSQVNVAPIPSRDLSTVVPTGAVSHPL